MEKNIKLEVGILTMTENAEGKKYSYTDSGFTREIRDFYAEKDREQAKKEALRRVRKGREGAYGIVTKMDKEGNDEFVIYSIAKLGGRIVQVIDDEGGMNIKSVDIKVLNTSRYDDLGKGTKAFLFLLTYFVICPVVVAALDILLFKEDIATYNVAHAFAMGAGFAFARLLSWGISGLNKKRKAGK